MLSLVPLGEGIVQTLAFAAGILVAPPIVGGLAGAVLLSSEDNVLDFRRLMGVEFVGLLPLAILLPIASLIGIPLGMKQLWEDGFLIGLTVSFPTRFLTPFAMSSLKAWRKIGAGLATPFVTTAAFLSLTPKILPDFNLPTIVLRVCILVISGVTLSAAGTSLIVRRVEREGSAEIGHSPMALFRAFLDHWLRKRPNSLEDRLLSLSTEGEIETRILSLSDADSMPRASIVVSNFHPGPYRDLGSGGLPSELKRAVQESQPAIVHVPHGISNHKLNIVSHRDIGKLLEAVKSNYPPTHNGSTASRMIRERVGEVTVSGQAFGRSALLTITLAPEEMEDLPTQVAQEIDKEAVRRGFEVLTIDAHNSIEAQTSITPTQAERITEAARKVLERLETLPQGPFMVGAAENGLELFTLEDGIGPGGLSVMVVRAQNQVVAYVTVDGNNMQRGLRDKILLSLRNAGADDGEVMTTDTHLVTGIVRSPLGYYPVGEHLPSNLFIDTITKTVQKAIASMVDARNGFSAFSLQLQVLGSETFQSITGFIGRIGRQIGRAFYRLEILSFFLALAILFVP